MKSWLIAVLMASVALVFAPTLAEAKRFGGGGSFGMQRSAPPPQRPAQPPSQPAQQPASAPAQPASAAAPAAGGAAAAAGARSWTAPLIGLAAGLGLVALFSHLGLGAELASFVMLALMVVAAVVVIRLLMRRFGGVAPVARGGLAGASASSASASSAGHQPPWMGRAAAQREAADTAAVATPRIGSALQPALAVPGVNADGPLLPEGFDRDAFERIAKAIFIRMQAANDSADLNDLRQFTTPEVFAELRLQLQERGAAAQHTDVVEVHAEVVDFAEDDGQQIVSVRYHGRVVEEAGAAALPFDEIWHLVKPLDGSREWAIAGVQQLEPA